MALSRGRSMSRWRARAGGGVAGLLAVRRAAGAAGQEALDASGSGSDRVTKPSACMIANPIRGRSRELGKTRKRGTHSGWNLALNLYSDSIWNQRDRNTSSPRQPRSTGPAPIRSPRASAERNIAKFSDTRVTPELRGLLEGGHDQQLVEPGVGGAVAAHQLQRHAVRAPRHEVQHRPQVARAPGAARPLAAPCGR